MSLPILAAFVAAGASYLIRRSGDPRRVFFSFHYADIWQVQQVRNSWVTHASSRAAGFFDGSLRESAKTHRESEIRRLIDRALDGTDVTAVLIGTNTAARRWVRFEIEQSARRGNGMLGIYIHKLRRPSASHNRRQVRRKGRDPFSQVVFDPENGATLGDYVPTYDWTTGEGYTNMRKWVRAAPTLREILQEHSRFGSSG